MISKADASVEIFNKGFNCAQAVLVSHCEEFGLSNDIGKKIACGFGAGMGFNGEVCGAVTGALMLAGLKYGKYIESDNESKDKTYKLVREFTETIKREYGTIICRELIKFDISKADEYQKAKESGIFKDLCPKLVRRSVELIEEILYN